MKKKILFTSLAIAFSFGMTSTCFAFDTVKKGDNGDTVIQIQSALITLGYLSGSADGAFGGGTEDAVSSFQADNELDVTGVVGEATYNKLMELSGAGGHATETQTAESSETVTTSDQNLFENVITGATFTDDDFTYEELEDGGLRIVEYHGTDDTVTISSSKDGKDIVEIGNGVFMDNTEIEDFIIWADLTHIGNGAFKGCTELETISIGSKTKSLGVSCFEGCTKLEDVILWADLEIIPDYCFKDCTELDSISISGKNKYIGKSAFEGCTDLEDVILWGGETIGEASFRNCTSLDSISVPRDIIFIGPAAFEGCSKLEDVVIWDKKETEICENAFIGCPFQPDGCNIVPVPEDYQGPATSASAETSAPAESEADQQVTEGTTSEVHTGIRPEFKEAMDSYEAFFDEYIEFLESYDANDMSMLLEYTSFLSQYSETMGKLEDIDESELSPEEDAYYLEVMLRIDQKLITVASKM